MIKVANKVANIRLREGWSFVRFEREPSACEHAWEFHLWERGHAYCPLCGSLADAPNDPRLVRR